ncbi:hypothetical protein [Acidovorax sp. SUPP2539]|uniref:hypothetical protein n=1 Tax=Acidovorax sp. SUPP2539 TaxID=2920878 RepID=UPI0023DE52B8|nr:hypothetical protein [Acidovorax sp. SUPP2539]GKS88768.1 hypothetical protein AVTE2539_05405 [Acidovorax sp. SUPP2539]
MHDDVSQDHHPSQAELLEMAARGRETLTIYEGGGFSSALLWILALLCVLPGVAMLRSNIVFALAFIAMAAAVGMLARGLGRRRKLPLLTLSAQGLQYSAVTQPIPWTAIENYRVGAGSHRGENLILFVDLSSDYDVPLKDARSVSAWHSVGRSWYNAKQDWIIFKVPRVQGMTNPQLIELFSTYWQAGLARAQLGNLDESLVG